MQTLQTIHLKTEVSDVQQGLGAKYDQRPQPILCADTTSSGDSQLLEEIPRQQPGAGTSPLPATESGPTLLL